MNPTNQNQIVHSQSLRSFTFASIVLEMLNADVSITGVLTQTHNEPSKGFNSTSNNISKYFIKSQDILIFNSKLSTSRTILLVYLSALISFPPISLYLGDSYMPSGLFATRINSYLMLDISSLS